MVLRTSTVENMNGFNVRIKHSEKHQPGMCTLLPAQSSETIFRSTQIVTKVYAEMLIKLNLGLPLPAEVTSPPGAPYASAVFWPMNPYWV